MKIKLGPPPIDDTIFKNDNTWRPLNEPRHMRFQVNGILVGLLITAMMALVLLARDPKYVTNISWPIVILSIFMIMPIHECLHALSFKGGIISKEVVFGFYPKAMAFYAHYSGIIPWYRYIFISLFPFLMLTLIPLLCVALLNLDHKYIVEIMFANGLVSAGDVLTAFIVIKQFPKRSMLTNSGMKTYWKPMANIGLQMDAAARPD